MSAQLHRLFWLSTLLVLSVSARADCEGDFVVCKEEGCEYSAKSAAIMIGSAIAATQGAAAGRQEQRDLDRCMRQCEQARMSCRVEPQTREADQARQRLLDQQRAMQMRDEADTAFLSEGSSPADLSHLNSGKALQWIAEARVHFGAKRYREALEHYESALEILPDHADAHFGAMLSAEALKETSSAKLHAARYLELEPNDPNSKAIRRKYPALATAQKARESSAAKAPPPPRPAVPVEVPEAVWQKLEASAAYRAYRTKVIGVRSHVQWDHRWINVDGEPDFIEFEREILIQPASAATSRETLRFTSSMGTTSHSETVTTFGGLLLIATRSADDERQSSSRLVAVEDIEGTLFPPSPGAVMRWTTLHESTHNDNEVALYKSVTSCRVEGGSPARQVAPDLPGQTWTIGCSEQGFDDERPSPPRTKQLRYFDAFATMSSQFLWTGNRQLPPYLPSVGDVQPDSSDGDHVVKAFDLSWE